jgi:hypothetical protein
MNKASLTNKTYILSRLSILCLFLATLTRGLRVLGKQFKGAHSLCTGLARGSLSDPDRGQQKKILRKGKCPNYLLS